MEINCEFDMCIYNKDNKCVLDSIKIGVLGNCETGITPVIPTDILDYYKDDMRKIFKNKSRFEF